MFTFPAPVASPAIKSQFQTQMTFFADVSQKMTDGLQKILALNIQVAKTVADESAVSAKMLLSSKGGSDALAVIGSLTQPSLEKVRAYQQHVQRIVSDTRADVSKSIEIYVPETTRAAQEVVQTAVQRASEQMAKVVQQQQGAMQQLTAAAKQNANRSVGHTASALEAEKEVIEKLTAAKQDANRAADANTKVVVSK